MSYGELLDFLVKVSKALEILRDYRSGKEISKEEKEDFRRIILEIGEKLRIPLLFNGKIVTKFLLRKYRPIMKVLGMKDIADELLFFLLRTFKEACTKEVDKKTYLISEELKRIKIHENYKGYIFEALGRLWLREVIGGHWQDVEYFIHDSSEIDALSKEKSGDMIFINAAEIKSGKIKRKHIDKFVENLNSLEQYWKEEMKHNKTIRKFNFKEIIFIAFSAPENVLYLKEEIIKSLRDFTEENNIKIYNIEDIINECKKQERHGKTILNAIEYLKELSLI
jgi:hypothetical protein